MKKSTILILLIGLIIAQIAIVAYAFTNTKNATIDNNYLAVFKGESGETVNSTYLYVIKKKKYKKYSYINTVSTFSGYDSGNWKEKIIKRGTLKRKKNIFEIAKRNKAYSYVKYEDGNIYSIDEFKGMFK